ncbi:Exonuclease III [Saccharicrinis carchari]|uniref:Exonuclease III n=1 Tax=Saccharicrinis carchari TaxID=1168039 RepID=A0A521BY18_SACCC|nr:endonuclease/exonuclease/phosphatase family protein [Saccharicrinis carchari]SMO51945.1 Exonuclease III [Saccharicrinis carchari]
MKRIKIMIALSVCSMMGLSFSCMDQPRTAKAEQTDTLKVLAWNIWHGGHSKAYPGIGCEGTIGILKHSNADVILMVETYGAVHQVADSLGYYHRLLSSNLSVFSRYPITKTYTFPDSISTFNFGGVQIDVEGQPVRVFDTWLHYLPDTRLAPVEKSEEQIIAWEEAGSRDEEIRTILNVLQPFLVQSDSIPVIIGGDFNSHSHLDWTVAARDMYHHGGAVVRWPVSAMLEEAGFKDSFREIHPNPAQYPGVTWLSGIGEDAPQRFDRIDYIYSHGNSIKTIHSETYNANLGDTLQMEGRDFFYASDHGFVLSTFKINR